MGKLNKIQEFDQTSIFCFFAPEFFAKNKKFIKGKKQKNFVFVGNHIIPIGLPITMLINKFKNQDSLDKIYHFPLSPKPFL